VFVGSGIFKSEDPAGTAAAIVKATAFYNDPEKVLEAARALTGAAMPGLELGTIEAKDKMSERGW
jgi:pyridoxal 5'-phosphate synthase pdxS subunit